MTQTSKKEKDLSEDQYRLDFIFDKGINFRDRIIQITGEIESGSSFDWLDAALTELEHKTKKGVTIKINSPGGSIYEALGMVDRIKDSKCHITTKCYGHAMSAAGLLLASGDSRYMGSNSWFMHHEISGGTEGTTSDMADYVTQMKNEMNQWANAMSHFSRESVEFWLHAAHKHNFYLNAEQCLEIGVIDGTF